MKNLGRIAWLIAVTSLTGMSMLAQTPQPSKPSFDVVSIKPSAPNPTGMRGGGPQGNRYVMSGATLRMLLQTAYRPPTDGPGQLQVFGAPSWAESDRYDIQATVDCSGGLLSRNQIPLMVQSMLEDRFQLKAHMETRELPIYNLVVAKDGPKIKASADQTPPLRPGGPPQPCGPVPAGLAVPPPPPPPGVGRGSPMDPNFVLPRGAMMMLMGAGTMTMQASGVPLTNLISTLQQQLGRPVIDKTDLTGLFDFKLQFSPEGLPGSVPPGGFAPPVGIGAAGAAAAPTVASDPMPSLSTAVQELGLRLESARGSVNVLVIESVQKPSVN